MKKLIPTILTAICFSSIANATVINLNIFQKSFSVENSSHFFRIDRAQVKTIDSIVDRVENPNFDSFSGEPVYFETSLKKEKVVQVDISYEINEGSIEERGLTLNLPLSMFSEEELMNRRTTTKAVERKIRLETTEVTRTVKEEYCADLMFDEDSTPMSMCNHVKTRNSEITSTILSVVNK